MKITKDNLDQIVNLVRIAGLNETMLFLGRSDIDSYNQFLASYPVAVYAATPKADDKKLFDKLTWRGVNFFITFIGE